MSDFQEGYNDGLAGAGAQRDCWDTDGYDTWLTGYGEGFDLGSHDRKAMLAPAGDVMQPVNAAVWADGMGDGDA